MRYDVIALFVLFAFQFAFKAEAQNIFVKELDFPDLNDFGGEGMITKGGNFIFKQQIRYSDSSIIRLIKVDKEGNKLKEKSISNVSTKYIIQYDGTIFHTSDSSIAVSHSYENDTTTYLTTVDTNLNILRQDTLLLGGRECRPIKIIELSNNSIKLIANCYLGSSYHFEAIEYHLITEQMTILDTAGYYNTRNELNNTVEFEGQIIGAFYIGTSRPTSKTGYFKYVNQTKSFEEFVESNDGKSDPILGLYNRHLFSCRYTRDTKRAILMSELDKSDFSVLRSRNFFTDGYPFTADIKVFDDRISVLVNVLDSFLKPRPYLFTCNKSNFDSLALVPLFPSDSIIGELWTMNYDENSEAFYFTGSINDPLKKTVVVRTDKFGCVQEMCLSQEEIQDLDFSMPSYVTCEELKTQIGMVEVIDVKGHAIYSGQSNGFFCEEQPPGMYFLRSGNEIQRLWVSDY